MSYPQGPQWQQAQPQHQYPQQQYPQQQYSQQGYPPPGYGGPQYPGPQPPKKGNGLLIGMIAGGGALVVVVFVILAFVAPGFLLSDSKSSNSASGSEAPLHLNWGSVLAGKFILAVFGDEPEKAAESACADAKDKVRKAVKEYGARNASLTAQEPRAAGPDLIVVTMTGTLDSSESFTGTMEVRREAGDKYCISSISPVPAG
ncbi:hypothetical protein SAMN04489729_0433 [Amycolatopsis lurida]|uniref:Uncharacterized protein n=1 Tax=Amycolatopsis lurida NRRL 2430 TaxID=1460371 RepID=A0A2P2FYA7_AMYLU|nr:hypothetical protein [Amycolatopsis lurida]KFU81708.1 hypothetical protein BB31_07585 [Amycolatopsis lurida NRRL 2430]SEB33389.1 hypothetical protein SAMN04489729_0433 [Amycolatopsis lurida]